MKTLIVANWKMNPSSQKEAVALFNAVKKGVAKAKNEVVICPPFIYLPFLKGLTLGAQNVFSKEKGAFTGEISPLMLKDLKVKYVIVGHSESRRVLQETDEIINKKLKAVLEAGLKPILCVGENENQEKSQVIETQLQEGLQGISSAKAKSIIVAYEPIWAIGTGKNCSIEETMTSILMIKSALTKLYSRVVANRVKILYGGSVDSKDASSYLAENFIDGLLIGGASLNAKEFVKIVSGT